MSRVHASAEGAFSPAAFVEALTDFGPQRSRLWGNSSAGKLVVHDRGDTRADVTEGTDAGGIWQRYRYDWADPHLIRLTVSRCAFPQTSARWSAVVPLLVAMACLAPQRSANVRSNSVMNLPADEIQVVSMHSATYAFSLPDRTGYATGIMRRSFERSG